MKKLLFVLISCLAIASCSRNEFNTYSQKEAIVKNYEDAFVEAFGQPAEDQDWGFGTSDEKAATRGYDTDANNWAQNGWTVPSKIGLIEKGIVLVYFSRPREQDISKQVDWSDFFVQQVYAYSDSPLHFVAYDQYMNYLTCGDNDEHIYNFNRGHGSSTYVNYAYVEIPGQDKNNWKKYWNDEISLMTNSSTSKFGYHNSLDSKQHYEYLIAEIGGEYYVGFDFYADGASRSQQVERDYVYNDWIIKISPGRNTKPKPAVRIICEDLTVSSTRDDFDFNDVVFDATYETTGKTTITIQAAGGTLPLFVQGREVHQLFADANPSLGITEKVMINTNSSMGISGLNPVSFTVDGIIAPWDITVAVYSQENLISLKSNTSQPAAKIAVNPSFEWCDEREDIRTKYPNFSNYVQDTSVDWY